MSSRSKILLILLIVLLVIGIGVGVGYFAWYWTSGTLPPPVQRVEPTTTTAPTVPTAPEDEPSPTTTTTQPLPENPVANPSATVSALLKSLNLTNDKARIMPVLQAYTAPDIAMEFNLAYGREEVEQQIDAAQSYGAGSVVLYDPSGEYDCFR